MGKRMSMYRVNWLEWPEVTFPSEANWHIDEIYDWMTENLSGTFVGLPAILVNDKAYFVFRFDTLTDAALVKLRFG